MFSFESPYEGLWLVFFFFPLRAPMLHFWNQGLLRVSGDTGEGWRKAAL